MGGSASQIDIVLVKIRDEGMPDPLIRLEEALEYRSHEIRYHDHVDCWHAGTLELEGRRMA